MKKQLTVALAGNPNSGKTTLFNSLTGSKQYVGNWAGVTVEKKEGILNYKDFNINVIDLPGTYSLSPYSMEEIIARNFLIDEKPDVVINIVDASNIERNLYLSMQLLELDIPVVIALNMMDVAEKRGYLIDVYELSKKLGTKVIPIVASKNKGIDELLDAVVSIKNSKSNNFIKYNKKIEKKITEIKNIIECNDSKYDLRWLAIKILEQDDIIIKEFKDIFKEESAATISSYLDDESQTSIADGRYNYISNVLDDTIEKTKEQEKPLTDRIDDILTHRWLGLPIFALIMFSVFYFTFDLVGNKLLNIIDSFINNTLATSVNDMLITMGVSEWLNSLIVDGIIGGVGGILVFLPNIACLFLAISILEDSGYMARVAFIMDRSMRRIGLSGKAFIPMILGFGCNVPAVMGTRALDDENDRLVTVLINPFMSCSARLTVYTLFAGIFFPNNEKFIVFSLYILGILIAVIAALIFKKTLFKGESSPFIIELPPYKVPSLKGIIIHVWDRLKGFLINAGTLIFGASIILWFVLGFNLNGPAPIYNSLGAQVGKVIAPIFKPLGFGDWRSALSLLSGVVAKEVVISNMAIIYGLEDASKALSVSLLENFSQISAYAFMVFVLLYTPCIATIGVIKKETNSWKWTIFSLIYQFMVAWTVAMIVYQIGKIIL
ncbi:MAG: ferrous iron transport protein B [Firmicutes bacterium]|nr:ferrous iron transport protein B [Bacillota bacterium]